MPNDWKDTSYNSLLVVVNRLPKISKPVQKIDAPWFPRLDRPRLRVLVPPILLSSLTGVTTNASSTKKILALVPDSMRNLMTVYKKNLLYGLDIANLFPPDLWSYVYRFGY